MSNHITKQNQNYRANPFAGSEQRDNFPSLADAFSTTTQFSGSEALNTSVGSVLSIGERAAMNDHLRHVAKFGLDASTDSVPRHHHNSSSDDSEWERLLQDGDEPSFDAYGSSSIINGVSGMTTPSGSDSSILQMTHEFHQGVSLLQEEGSEEIEIIALDNSDQMEHDASSDYFNTSRVLELFTPERNLERQPRVSSRQLLEDSLSSSSTSDHHQPHDFMRLLQQTAMGSTPGDCSFLSLSAVDVSRISHSDESSHKHHSQHQSSSSSSNQLHAFHESSFVLDNSFAAAATPNRSFLSASGSPPRRRPPLHPRASPNLSPNTSQMINLPMVEDIEDQNSSRSRKENDLTGIPVSLSADTAARAAAEWMEARSKNDQGPMQASAWDHWSDVSSVQDVSSPSSYLSPDRRLYRTVVPQRVFMDHADNENDYMYPEQGDSFSAPPATRLRDTSSSSSRKTL